MWFRSFLLGFIIAQCLLLSGDVELNPGPLDTGIVVLHNGIYIHQGQGSRKALGS